MNNLSPSKGRRNFLRSAAALTAGMAGLTSFRASAANYGGFAAINAVVPPPARSAGVSGDNDHNIIGPKEGYSPQIGTLVSMMAWLRPPITNAVKGMTVEQLDFLLDAKANTIGALLYHLAATDAFYHEHTFNGLEWGKFDPAVMKKYEVAMSLGEAGRKQIRGNTVDFYLNLLQETRESTLAEFKKRDDKWLMTVDEKWYWGPTNNYCKWFHVAEHESHHYGQIALLKSRVPGAKPADSGG
ncbi:MAG TPA: DinB family protein [Puia sp.]|nr:DinB family protein [Puia sp.]